MPFLVLPGIWLAIRRNNGLYIVAAAATAIAVVVMIYWMQRGGRKRQTALGRRCHFCGYDRSGITARQKCPECGRGFWL